MEPDKIFQLVEFFEELTPDEQSWVYKNLNHLIDKFIIKFNKPIQFRL